MDINLTLLEELRIKGVCFENIELWYCRFGTMRRIGSALIEFLNNKVWYEVKKMNSVAEYTEYCKAKGIEAKEIKGSEAESIDIVIIAGDIPNHMNITKETPIFNPKFPQDQKMLVSDASMRVFPKEGDTFGNILDLFWEEGWGLRLEALKHCYLSWCNQYKSGFFEEGVDKYECFTPCGCCNPLSFTAFPKSKGSHTYFC